MTLYEQVLAFARENGATEELAKGYVAGVATALLNPEWAEAVIASCTEGQRFALHEAAKAVVEGVPA